MNGWSSNTCDTCVSILQIFLLQERTDKHRLSTGAIRVMLGIMMGTTLTPVYQKARSIVLEMIRSPSMKSADAETRECIKYETSLWVDGLTEECVEELCSLLSSAANNAFQHGIAVAQAWKSTGFDAALPPVCFSPLLTSSLTTICSASEHFALFSCQVLTKCLLYQRHPLLLASLIANTTVAETNLNLHPVNLLRGYAQTLLALDEWDAEDCLSLLWSLLQCLFSPDCLHSVLLRNVLDKTNLSLCQAPFSGTDVGAAVRQCLQLSALESITSDFTRRSMSQLRTLIPLVKRENAGLPGSHFDTIAQHPLVTSRQFPWTEVAYLYTAALSLPVDNATGSRHKRAIALANRIGLDGLDASPNSRMRDLVFFSFLNPLLPCEAASRTVREILRQVCVAFRNVDSLFISSFNSLALYWIEKRGPSKALSFVPLDAALETWRVLVENCELNNSSGPLAHHIEALLSHAIKLKNSKNSSLLYSLLLNSPSSETIRMCIRSKYLRSRLQDQTATISQLQSLLSSLLVSDPDAFGRSFLKILAEPDSNINVPLLLEEGFFDEEIAALSKSIDLLTTEEFDKVRNMVVKRALKAISLLSEAPHANRGRRFNENIVRLLSIPGLLQSSHVDTFINQAFRSLRSRSKMNSKDDSWFKLSHTLLCCEDPKGALHESNRLGLSSAVLVRAFQTLQSSLKSHFKSNTSGASSETGQICAEALDLVSDIIAKQMAYDDTMLTTEGSHAVTDAIKASLKYGLTHANDENSTISGRCLRLIRTLLVEASDPSSTLNVLKTHCVLLNPLTIFAMVVAHSHFHEIMTGVATQRENHSSRRTILELVRLLLVCTSMSRDTVLFESNVWVDLLTAYNAGTTPVDITLRRLIDVYADALADRGMVSCFMLTCRENIMAARLLTLIFCS